MVCASQTEDVIFQIWGLERNDILRLFYPVSYFLFYLDPQEVLRCFG
jgi:hypothetical protein